MTSTDTDIPVYDHCQAPEGLRTRKQWRRRGRRVRHDATPAARIRWSSDGHDEPTCSVYTEEATERLSARSDSCSPSRVRAWIIRERNTGIFGSMTGPDAVDYVLRGLDELEEAAR